MADREICTYVQSDLEEVNQWRKDRDLPPIPFNPSRGVIVHGVACGFYNVVVMSWLLLVLSLLLLWLCYCYVVIIVGIICILLLLVWFCLCYRCCYHGHNFIGYGKP